MDSFLRTVGNENRILHIHGVVFVPFNTPLYDELRVVVYRKFYFNTPYGLWHVIRTVRFRLLFIAWSSFGDQVRIERLRVSTEIEYALPRRIVCES